MNSLEGIIAANRAAEKTQALNRATNGKPDNRAVKRAVQQTNINLQPKRDASGRLAR
jgi:hypothetical protein